MARIAKDRIAKGNRNCRAHEVVDCEYDVFYSGKEKLIQLSTFGTSSRKVKNTVSQSIQIDEATAKFLVDLLKKEFHI